VRGLYGLAIMGKLLWVKDGMVEIADSAVLALKLGGGDWKSQLLTDSPLTFDFDATIDDVTLATFTGSTAINMSLTKTGPWVNETDQEVYYKIANQTWTNGSGAPVTVTGVAVIDTADDNALKGVLVFDDEEALGIGDAIELELFPGIGQGGQESPVTILEAP